MKTVKVCYSVEHQDIEFRTNDDFWVILTDVKISELMYTFSDNVKEDDFEDMMDLEFKEEYLNFAEANKGLNQKIKQMVKDTNLGNFLTEAELNISELKKVNSAKIIKKIEKIRNIFSNNQSDKIYFQDYDSKYFL